MKKYLKYIIIVLLVILIVFLVWKICLKNRLTAAEKLANENGSITIKNEEKIGNVRISDIEVNVKDGKTIITAGVHNDSKEEDGNFDVQLLIHINNSQKIINLTGYIENLEPEQSKTMMVEYNKEISNIYTVKIMKSK